MAVANFEGDGNGGGSDVTEIIREEDADDNVEAALPDPPPPAASFHGEDDHYDNIQVFCGFHITSISSFLSTELQ